MGKLLFCGSVAASTVAVVVGSFHEHHENDASAHDSRQGSGGSNRSKTRSFSFSSMLPGRGRSKSSKQQATENTSHDLSSGQSSDDEISVRRSQSDRGQLRHEGLYNEGYSLQAGIVPSSSMQLMTEDHDLAGKTGTFSD